MSGSAVSQRRWAIAAAALTAAEAAVLLALAVYYVVELGSGVGDTGRVVSSTVLIVVVAGGLLILARLWLRGSAAARTPTVVWNALLVPVTIALAQAGQQALAAGLGVVVLLSLVAAAAARRPSPDDGDEADNPDDPIPGRRS